MVRIRMKRMGRRNRPFFRITAIHKGTQRDGRVIERLGWYNPLAGKDEKNFEINAERVKYWISQGAQPSDSVLDMLRREKIVDEAYWHEKRGRFIEAKKSVRIKELEAKKIADEAAAKAAAEEAAKKEAEEAAKKAAAEAEAKAKAEAEAAPAAEEAAPE